MVKTQLLSRALIISIALLAAALLAVYDRQTALGVRTAELRSAQDELQKLKQELAARNERLAALQAETKPPAVSAVETPHSAGEAPPAAAEPQSSPVPTAAPKPDQSYRIRARVSAIEKFVPLTAEQRERLEEKFKRDLSGPKPDDAGSGTDELADILGKENAEYYRSEMRRAFENAATEERERDVFYLSRKLALTPDQETQLADAMASVEKEVNANRAATASAGQAAMEDRIKLILRENELRQKLLNEQLQKIFTPEQYQRYVEQQLGSSEGNFPVWHESE